MEREYRAPSQERAIQLTENVPDPLKEQPYWVVWKYEGEAGTKPKKPPFSVDGRRASVTNPNSWSTFPEALQAYTQSKDFEGLGFMLPGGLTVIDLDNCLDNSGNLLPEDQWIVQSSNSYTEISPSGRGVHVFLFGSVPGTARRRENKEMYDEARYITVTGQRFLGTPAEIRADQEIINQIHTKFIRPLDATTAPRITVYQPRATSDQEVIEKAFSARNGAKFEQLWRGSKTEYGSPSQAHLALVAMLAFSTNSDPVQMDRLFRLSGQFDERTAKKWDERHSASGKTYGEMTIEKAIATRQNYSQRSPKRNY